MQKFYEATKRVFGAQKRSILPVRGLDGVLIKEGIGIKERCAEHFCTLVNHTISTDHSILQELPSYPILYELDSVLSFEKVTKAIASLKMNQTEGPGAIHAKLLEYGGVQLHLKLHYIISEMWSSEPVHQVLKAAFLIAIYKNISDREDFDKSRDIALLIVAGKGLGKIILRIIVQSIYEPLLPETLCISC